MQDTLIRALRGVERFDGAHPGAWLLTVLRNTHLNHLRREHPVLLRDRARRAPRHRDEPEAQDGSSGKPSPPR